MRRLGASAAALGFPFDPEAFDGCIARGLAGALAAAGPEQALRVRVALSFDGRLSITHAPLVSLDSRGGVRVLLADEALPSGRPLARHKTSRRGVFDAGIRAAEAEEAFDMLFFDERGRLLEGGRTNVFVRLGGRWFTPPLADGVLPGVMRGLLLEDPAWAARERSISRADVLHAEALVVCNALRGALPARLVARRALVA